MRLHINRMLIVALIVDATIVYSGVKHHDTPGPVSQDRHLCTNASALLALVALRGGLIWLEKNPTWLNTQNQVLQDP